MEKEKKKDKIFETFAFMTKKHNINKSDEISVQNNEIAEIDV